MVAEHEVPTPRQLFAPIRRFDTAIERAFDSLRGKPVVDRAFYTVSELGDFSLIWHLLATTQGLRRDGDLAGTVRLVSIMGIESVVVNGVVKSMFRRQRPVHEGPRPFNLRQPRTSSFPSGHASAAAVFAVVASEDDALAPLYVRARRSDRRVPGPRAHPPPVRRRRGCPPRRRARHGAAGLVARRPTPAPRAAGSTG